ncbi:MAG: ferritin-like domain-containing protein [Bacillota bacterium]|nr:ferritin-like domain-containing protein [Bacillota bacterium]
MMDKPTSPGMYFGADAAGYADAIRGYIDNEIYSSKYYELLARKAPSGKRKQTILKMSQDEIKHAKKLATAYFLATGNHYFSQPPGLYNRIPPFRIALRERFKEEYAASAKYSKTAEETDDSLLQELLGSLAQDERRHAAELQEMIEESI